MLRVSAPSMSLKPAAITQCALVRDPSGKPWSSCLTTGKTEDKIETPGIIDHGPRPPGPQLFGPENEPLLPGRFEALKKQGCFPGQSTMVLYGCFIAKAANYAQEVANKTGCKVVASCGYVYYPMDPPLPDEEEFNRPFSHAWCQSGAVRYEFVPGQAPVF
jgi:hypothetical protein